MNADKRRKKIESMLKKESRPIKGTEIANMLNVSRQIIVQDIALLRAQGVDIIATPQGYVILKSDHTKLIKTIVAKHHDYNQMEEELQIMIDHGIKILDVIVEHPIYGEIRGILDISYREELQRFMRNIKSQNGEPLSSLTEGIHIHTIEVPNEETFERVKKILIGKGYLINE